MTWEQSEPLRPDRDRGRRRSEARARERPRPHVEALLFLSPQPVSAADLAEATEATEGQVEEAIELLREDLAEGKRGVVLREVAGGFTLASDPGQRGRRAAPAGEAADAAADPGPGRDAGDRRLPAAGLAARGRPDPRRHLGVGGADAGRARPDRGVRPLAVRRRDLQDHGAVRAALRPLRARPAARSLALRPDARRTSASCASGCSRPGNSAPSREAGPGRSVEQQRGGSVGPPRPPLVRLAKFLAHGGVASRRKAEEIIANGRVTVGGEVVTDPARDVGEGDDVRVDGEPGRGRGARGLGGEQAGRGGLDRAASRGRGRRWSSWSTRAARLYPVGRLDADSTGLLLLTNDGELANRLTHPRYEVAKTYRARAAPAAAASATCARLRAGVELEDGPTAPAEVQAARRARDRDRPARGPQPPGAADGRGGRQPGRGPAPRPLRPARARRPRARARRAGSPRRRSPGSGKMRAVNVGRYEPHEQRLFAVRGAAQAEANEAEAILAATEELMRELIERNELEPEAMVSCLFTTTDDLDAEFPAVAARELGLDAVPLLCCREIPVPGLDAAGDPGDGPLLRAGRPRARRTSTSARRRSCAPTSTPPSSGRVGTIGADDRHLRREARPHARATRPACPTGQAPEAIAAGGHRPARLERVAVPAAPEGGRGDRAPPPGR